MKNIGTVLALVFNPKSDIDLFKLEHLDKLEIHMTHLDWPEPLISAQTSDKIKRTLKILKEIGEAAKNIRWLIVGDKSFYYPEIYKTGFKNFGTPLKVLTLKDGCFDVMNYNNVMTCDVVSVNTFFKSMSENCPNLSSLNLGSAHELGSDNFKQLSIAGFGMVKELNVHFVEPYNQLIGNGRFNWFFGLINDCNNIETLSLNSLIYPFFGDNLDGEMALIEKKFKNLKKCQITFNEEFESIPFNYASWSSCKEYAYALAKDLDETFADRSTEFKVQIQAIEYADQDGTIEEEKCFQIIKMPFKNSAITRHDS